MFIKLLKYNWQVFRHSLTAAKLFVLIVYGLLLILIFSQLISTIFLLVTLQSGELSKLFEWYTPERGRFLLLAFANILWLSQFFFTNIRLLNLQENRKLLSMGYPLQKLSRHLSVMAFFHPLNLLFSITWFVFLMLQFGSIHFVPLALAIVIINFSIIFSIKFRVLTVFKNYQKWAFLIVLTVIFIFASSINDIFSTAFFSAFDLHLSSISSILSFLPGGLLTGTHSPSIIIYITGIICCVLLFYYLQKDHIKSTRKALQAPVGDNLITNKTGKLKNLLCKWFGNHAGKYIYYVISHPYNRIHGLFVVVFPLLYIPLSIAPSSGNEAPQFIILFFFIYMPLGFQMLFLANMYGYENRELLRELQFPVLVKQQLQERFLGALLLPAVLLVIASVTELFLLPEAFSVSSILLGNLLIFEAFIVLFLWSTFNQYKKVKWVSFSFTSPVISQSVGFICGLLMLALSATVYISYGSFEIYKQGALLILVPLAAFWIYRYIKNIQQPFSSKIMPRLWNEL
ncbi:MAG TPA: hypothetical protein VF181_09665 [Balneolaceae bacterium]